MPDGLLTAVQGMGGVQFWLLLAFALVVTAVGFKLWRDSFRDARLMEDTPTSRIRSAAQGFVELVGTQDTAMDRRPRAPLTGREATWWSYSIEKKETHRDSNGNRQTRWRTVEKKTSPDLILLRDGTGEVVVNPAGAQVTAGHRERWYGHSRHPAGGPGGGDGGGIAGVVDFLTSGRYRYTEELMRPGDPLFALGHFETRTSVPDSEERIRRRTELLAEWKENPAELVARFDEDGDGRVDMEEWERARAAAEAAVEEQVAREAGEPDVHLLLKPPDGRPFVLSVKEEEELTGAYRVRSVAFLILFLVGVVGTGLLLTGRFAG